jgi:galactose mutarotase-like enzyme
MAIEKPIMETQVYRTDWHNLEGWTLASSDLQVTIVPSMGAKIVSLVDRQTESEWLIDSGNRPFRPAAYGSSFTEQDMSGWDEMFPTIVACAYPGSGVHHGALLPDHGEVWSLPWQITQAGEGSLTLSIQGHALPYQLTRKADCPEPATLRLRYSVKNMASDPMPYIWAAHPQFSCGPDGQVVLPPEISEVVNTIPESWGWGPPETRFGWPEATGLNGLPVRTDRVGPETLKSARKFFALPHTHPTWAAVLRRDTGQWVRFEWNSQQVPYLGLWIDEGVLNHRSVATPEPTTGWYDDLALAYKKGLVTTLSAGETQAWTLTIRLGHDGQPAPQI